MSSSTSEIRVRLVRRETGLSPRVKYFTDRSKTDHYVIHLLLLFLLFFFLSCSSVYWCFVVICWEMTGLFALVCDV